MTITASTRIRIRNWVEPQSQKSTNQLTIAIQISSSPQTVFNPVGFKLRNRLPFKNEAKIFNMSKMAKNCKIEPRSKWCVALLQLMWPITEASNVHLMFVMMCYYIGPQSTATFKISTQSKAHDNDARCNGQKGKTWIKWLCYDLFDCYDGFNCYDDFNCLMVLIIMMVVRWSQTVGCSCCRSQWGRRTQPSQSYL